MGNANPSPKANLVREGQSAQSFAVSQNVPVACKHDGSEVAGVDRDVAAAGLAWEPRVGDVDALLHVERELNVVDPREIAASRWLRFLRMDRKTIAIDPRVRDVGVELPRLHEAEVASLLRREPRQVVELEAHEPDGVLAVLAAVVEPVVDAALAVAPDRPHQLDDGVVEVQRQPDLARARADLVGLHLRDELFEAARGEAVALVDVQVHVRGLDEGAQVLLHEWGVVARLEHDDGRGPAEGGAGVHRGRAGRLDRRGQLREAHVQLDAVELQAHDRESVAARLREPERQRHVHPAVARRVLYQVLQAHVLADHFPQPLAGFPRKFLPHKQVVRIYSVDHLSTNYEGRATDQPLSNRVGVVGPRCLNVLWIAAAAVLTVARSLASSKSRIVTARVAEVVLRQPWVPSAKECCLCERRAGSRVRRARGIQARVVARINTWQVNHYIRPEEQVTGPIECELCVAPEHHLGIERLFNGFHRKVGIAIVTESPVRNAWILRQILVSCPKRDQLSQRPPLGSTYC